MTKDTPIIETPILTEEQKKVLEAKSQIDKILIENNLLLIVDHNIRIVSAPKPKEEKL